MIRKSGDRFSGKIMLKKRSQSAMTIQISRITL